MRERDRGAKRHRETCKDRETKTGKILEREKDLELDI
jgi:hypothetical protein